ncbi:MAG TPA: hypothetical protein VEB86_03810, partial [Chryseosolibacter sp.]|nr:hypothetical protein [Chryseosolibacter sp.]
MNLDELKAAWKVYDRRLQATQEINERLIVSMITERSVSRFSRVRKNYGIGFIWMAICLAAGLLVIFGNPFDFRYQVQYVPMIIFCSGIAILMAGMIKPFLELKDVSINHLNVD